eukprot:CAMPEP_0117040218 /NCGR_PEP_ID=MMETSP0472-20121206/28161_1 /TAXON_ID=693140 ORGANISM="Tiarina fusus, Strain LIS" /NCGR_SAMPLE_ID=MMETSP0472 /ASSEMBLY_ACC=CAM_ASM_000603 /LENGTH=127 /DNA_ID=CAMNT_0004750893 /DNA_START=17 /DNA_END=400 /DNA_ORIENTATION=-
MVKVRIQHLASNNLLHIKDGRLEAKAAADSTNPETFFLKNERGETGGAINSKLVHLQHDANNGHFIVLKEGVGAVGTTADTFEWVIGRGFTAFKCNGKFLAFDSQGEPVAVAKFDKSCKMKVIPEKQ